MSEVPTRKPRPSSLLLIGSALCLIALGLGIAVKSAPVIILATLALLIAVVTYSSSVRRSRM